MTADVRLQKFLSQSGIASRRAGEKLITSGKVRVNGRVVTELGTKVDPTRDRVEVDGQVAVAKDHVYVLLNKPKGYVTTVDDPQGRKTVMELLPRDLPRGVVPVGRLDFYTEGVLLFTNDGELSAALLHPRYHVEKTYHAKIRGTVTPAEIQKLRDGVVLDDGRKTNPAKVDLLQFTGAHTWLVITIREGRSRQIHRMAEAIGKQVIKLARVAFAGLTYFGLKVGEARRLDDREVRALRHVAGLDLDGAVAKPARPRGATQALPSRPVRPVHTPRRERPSRPAGRPRNRTR